ncbi:MAG: hypothetical protein A2Z14_11165 [Chloroflexi bacterium RBG_16_48_8]|nr:MAG: hypothetical protein A2Z14_11165 [Chloroflexi bacterium RBG_16_48_8]
MINMKEPLAPAAALIRATVWGQLVGYLAIVTMIGIEDAPDFFARINLWSFLWPPLILLLMHLFQLDKGIATLIPRVWIITGMLLLSIFTFLAIVVGVWLSLNIPESLITPGWEYTQTTSIIALYLCALSITIYFSIRTCRSSKEV